jgi:hypothetical protein
VRKVVFSLTAALTLGSVSCSNENGIYPVSGMVKYNGSPAAGAVVFFYRQGGDSMNDHTIMGIVQEDGTFDLVCGSLGKGAAPGEYDVVIQWKQATGQGKGRSQHKPDQMNGRYADPTHPLLHATVEAKATKLPPFELTDVE